MSDAEKLKAIAAAITHLGPTWACRAIRELLAMPEPTR